MARVVLGLGSSHGPTMKTAPSDVLPLGQKDRVDPRLDYDALLAWAKPDIERELAPNVLEAKYARCQAGIAAIAELLTEAAPDALIVLSNLHGVTPDYQQQKLAIFIGDSIPRSGGGGRPGAPWHATAQPRPARIFPADAELARYVYEGLNDCGFDVHSCADAEAARIGHEFTEIYDLYEPTGTLPMVPFMI